MNRWAQVSRRLVFFRLSAETSQYNPNKIQSALIQSRDEEKSMSRFLHQHLKYRTGHAGTRLQNAMGQRPMVQDRLVSVQGGNVRTLEEFPDRNLLAPEQRLLHGGHPVGGIMSGILFELLHTRTEPLVRIVVIVSHARAEDVQEREARMLDALLDQLGQMLLLAAETARNERRSGCQGQRNGIDRRFDVAERHAFRFHADAAGWRGLARGQTVDLVIDDDVEQVHVAAHRMDKMVAADPEAVAVTACYQNGQLVIGKLQAGGHRQGAAVQRVHSVGIHVPREVRRASDTADGDHVVGRYPQLNQRLLYRLQPAHIAATRTPVGIDFAFQIRHGQLLTGTLYACRHLRILLRP